jgi:hypothetical protein
MIQTFQQSQGGDLSEASCGGADDREYMVVCSE